MAGSATAHVVPGAGPLRAGAPDPGFLGPAGLASIGLDELNDRAAMLTRVDRKYALDAEQVPQVLAQLDPATRVLEIDRIRLQSYRSTYFDTPDLDSFLGTAHQRRRRFKVRTRLYTDSGLAFLEVKTRGARKTTVKERIPLPVEAAEADVLTPAGLGWVADQLAGIGQDRGLADALGPVLRCSYRRLTLAMPDGGRATVDTDLVWTGADGRALDCPSLVIVETKSGSSPSRLDRVLWSLGHRPARISKFGTAMAALDPSLPANRWTRVLRRSGLAPSAPPLPLPQAPTGVAAELEGLAR